MTPKIDWLKMRTLKLLLIALCIGTVSACSNSNPIPDKNDGSFTDLKITLERTACFGVCPSYIVEISGDGTVAYCGVAFVDEIGRKTRQIEPQKVQSLYDQMLAADFFNLRDRYTGRVTDNPTQTVSLSVDGRQKTVVDYVGSADGMPESVTAIQNTIDDIAETAEWVGALSFDHQWPEETPKCVKEFKAPT